MSELALLVNAYAFMEPALVRHERRGDTEQPVDVVHRGTALGTGAVAAGFGVVQSESDGAVPDGKL